MMKNDSFFLKAAFGLAMLIFLIGLFVPLEIAESVPYVFVVLLMLWVSEKRLVYAAGTLTTILSLAGLVFVPMKIEDWNVVLANLTISIIGIWLCVFVVLRQKQLEEMTMKSKKELEVLNSTLEVMVSQRTNSLSMANKDLERSKVELQLALGKEIELNEMKSRFVTMASHEFRTPLSSIMSSASLIGQYYQTSETDKMTKHLTRIKSSVNDLIIMLDDFLSIEKLESGKFEVAKRSFNLPEFCEDVLEDIQAIIKTGQKITYIHIGDKEILADKKIVQHILLNLLSNASKYSDENKEIELYTEVNTKNVYLRIKDHGIGIPEAEHGEVFSRFFRAHNSVNIKGTGLGLNIVKRYVELINGSIKFNSEENEGTTFIVEFPNLQDIQ